MKQETEKFSIKVMNTIFQIIAFALIYK
jgi:hypothetical protein